MKRKIHHFCKKSFADITILLSFLLIFGISLGLLAKNQRDKKNQTNQNTIKMSTDELIVYMHPFFISHGIEQIADLLAPRSVQDTKTVLTLIVDTPEMLTHADKLKLLVMLARQHKNNPIMRHAILQIISDYAKLASDQEPILYTLARLNNYNQDILLVRPLMNQEAQMSALTYALDKNNVQAFNVLLSGMLVDQQDAQQLLWRVIETEKDPAFLDILKKYNPDVNQARGNHTPLMIVVEKRNIPLVKKVLELGGDANQVVDNATGSALQIALIKESEKGPYIRDYVAIEELLRKSGALERTP